MPPYLEREVRAEQVPGTRKTELLGFTVPAPQPRDGNGGWGRISLLSLYLFCSNKGNKKMSRDITTVLPASSSPYVSSKGTAVRSRLHLG